MSKVLWPMLDTPRPNCQVYGQEDLLMALHHVPQAFDPELLQRVLDSLRPEGARVLWMSSDFKARWLASVCERVDYALDTAGARNWELNNRARSIFPYSL